MSHIMKKVLIVDDSRTNLTWAASQLANAGFEVLTRSEPLGTSVEALREKPDLILMDVEMPLLQGDQIVPTLKSRSKGQLSVILYSSLSSSRLEELVTSSGADGYIHKTSNGSEFIRQVNKFFNKVEGNEISELEQCRVVLLAPDIKCSAMAKMVFKEFPQFEVHKYLNEKDALDDMDEGNINQCLLIGGVKREGDWASMEIIKKFSTEYRLPVVMIGNEGESFDHKSLAGVTHYLQRPIDISALNMVIRDIINSMILRSKSGKERERPGRLSLTASFDGLDPWRSVAWYLNEHGAFLFTPKTQVSGTLGSVSFSPTNSQKELILDCEVVFSRSRTIRNFPIGLGLSFKRADPLVLKELRAYLDAGS